MANLPALHRLRPPDPTPDGDLLRRYHLAGDHAAFELLVRRHAPLVFRICRSVTGDPHRAEDATQAVFLVLARKAGALAGVRCLSGWLARVAYRAAARCRCRPTRDALPDLADPRPDPADAIAAAEQHAAVAEEVARLPARYRAPVVLCYFDRLSYPAAAARLGWPAGTVSGRLARARRLLRTRLERRGVTLPAVAAVALPAGLTDRLTAAPSASACRLASEVLSAMPPLSRRVFAACGLTLLGVTAALLARPDDPPKPVAPPPKVAALVVEGRVLDAAGKNPMPGVKVWVSVGAGTLLRASETATGTDGRFRLSFHPGMLAGGRVGGLVAVVHASKPGWYSGTYGWPAAYLLRDEPPAKTERPPKGYDFLSPGETARIEFRMAPAAALRVRLTDAAGKPLADAPVWLTGDRLYPATSVMAQGRTDAAGVWSAPDIPCWSFRLVVGDKANTRRELTVGQIDFTEAAEYTAEVTVREWTDAATDVGFRVRRGRKLSP